jgi:hypothetical protein
MGETEGLKPEIVVDKLYDHYKDTFTYIREYIKQRDLFFWSSLVVLVVMSFQASFPATSITAISQVLEQKVGIKASIDPSFINTMLWLILFVLLTRYYQTFSLMDKQYAYIHAL